MNAGDLHRLLPAACIQPSATCLAATTLYKAHDKLRFRMSPEG